MSYNDDTTRRPSEVGALREYMTKKAELRRNRILAIVVPIVLLIGVVGWFGLRPLVFSPAPTHVTKPIVRTNPTHIPTQAPTAIATTVISHAGDGPCTSNYPQPQNWVIEPTQGWDAPAAELTRTFTVHPGDHILWGAEKSEFEIKLANGQVQHQQNSLSGIGGFVNYGPSNVVTLTLHIWHGFIASNLHGKSQYLQAMNFVLSIYQNDQHPALRLDYIADDGHRASCLYPNVEWWVEYGVVDHGE